MEYWKKRLKPRRLPALGAHTRRGHSIIISSGFYISELRNTKYSIKNIGKKKQQLKWHVVFDRFPIGQMLAEMRGHGESWWLSQYYSVHFIQAKISIN